MVSPTIVGTIIGFGLQCYSNAVRKYPLYRRECLNPIKMHSETKTDEDLASASTMKARSMPVAPARWMRFGAAINPSGCGFLTVPPRHPSFSASGPQTLEELILKAALHQPALRMIQLLKGRLGIEIEHDHPVVAAAVVNLLFLSCCMREASLWHAWVPTTFTPAHICSSHSCRAGQLR